MTFTVRAGPAWFIPLVLAGCGGERAVGNDESHQPLFAIAPAPAQADLEEFELCKSGSAATFSYSITLRSTGAVSTGTVNLADGECKVLIGLGGSGADVSVTETGSAAGFQLDHVDVTTVVAPSTSTTQTVSGPTVSGTVGGSGLPGGALVLDVPLRLLDNGNIQAHYDQPHGNKP